MIAMHFPRFWARGEDGNFRCWRWSDTSYEEALAAAREAAARLRREFPARGEQARRYGYADRPLREPILHQLLDASGQVSAVVTRNSYGCHVLNAAGAMFADIDLDDEQEGASNLGAALGSVFGRAAGNSPADRALARADAWARSQPGWNWRVYRTRAGLRLLATHALFHPKDPFCQAVFEAVGADPLYRKLCDTQQSFRARLTPKPWRCDLHQPPTTWPFQSPAAEQKYLAWEAKYRHGTTAYATCQLLVNIGTGAVIEPLYELITLHDQVSRASSGLPLA
jgi:hypothetical protein